MVILDEMRRSRVGYASAFKQFMDNFSAHQDSFHCFVEGVDDWQYYLRRIRENRARSEVLYQCEGRVNVLKILELISGDEAYGGARCLYFVDHDFYPAKGHAYLYQTPCYSIENLYCASSVVKDVLVYIYAMDKNSPEVAKCVELYCSLREDFVEKIALFTGWIAAHRLKEFESKTRVIDLSDVKLHHLVQIELQGVKALYSFDTIPGLFPETLSVSREECDSALARLRTFGLERFTRGKYLLAFMLRFIELLLSEAKKPAMGLFNSCSPRCFEQIQKPLTVLSDFAITPKCLPAYIENITRFDLQDAVGD